MKVKTNWRVTVDVPSRYWSSSARAAQTEDEWQRDAEDLAAQVRRHCDGAAARIEFDYECSHCGRAWEIDADNGLPACCDQAIVEAEAK